MSAGVERQIGREFLGVTALLLVLNACVPAFYHDLWNPDEPRVAHLAQRMLLDGHWVVPRVNDEVFIEQPPLQAWLIAIPMALFGHGFGRDWVPRVPTAVFALATLWLVYSSARRHWGSRVALLAVVLLATTVEFYVAYQRAVVDTSLTFFVTLAMLQLLAAVGSREPRPLSWRQAVLLGVATGGAFLSKNLIGVVFVALVGSALASRFPRTFLKPPACWRLVAAVGLAVALPLPWLVAVGLEDPHALRVLLVDNTVGRFFSEGKHNPEFFEFLHRCAGVLLPALLPALVLVVRRVVLRADREREPRLEALVWWILLPAALILGSGSKREIYFLPVTPAVALAAAVEIDRWLGSKPVHVTSIALLCTLGIAAVALSLLGGIWTRGPLPWPIWVYLIALLGILYRWWRQRGWRDRVRTTFTAVAVALAALGMGGLIFFMARNDRESYVKLCRDLSESRDLHGSRIVGVDLPLRDRSALPYYLGPGVELIAESDVEPFLAEGASAALLVFHGELPERLTGRPFAEYRVRRKIFVVPNTEGADLIESSSE